jgi:two-component system sensor histidine kinase DesK
MDSLADASVPTTRWARQILRVVEASALVAPVLFTMLLQRGLSATLYLLTVVLGVGIGAIQRRHTRAASRGLRPAGWIWTLLLMAALVYIPLPWLGLYWGLGQAALIASALMIMGGKVGAVPTVVVLTVWTVIVGHALWGDRAAARFVFDVGTSVMYGAVVGLAVFGAVVLVRIVDETASTHVALADLATGMERLRLSRDMHDLLGQSLSAVSLKGDLAMRLLPHDAVAARVEIEGLTGAARDALLGVRAMTRDGHNMCLPDEIATAVALLGAAGIRVQTDIDHTQLSAPIAEVLAWVVREGVTNVIRHSDATACMITLTRGDDTVRLDILNDGAGRSHPDRRLTGPGTGVTGLKERASAMSGQVWIEHTGTDIFRLSAEFPAAIA